MTTTYAREGYQEEMDKFLAWHDDQGTRVEVRLTMAGTRHSGPLSTQKRPSDGKTTLRVRDTRRGRKQYQAFFDLKYVEVKVGARFVPAREVIA